MSSSSGYGLRSSGRAAFGRAGRTVPPERSGTRPGAPTTDDGPADAGPRDGSEGRDSQSLVTDLLTLTGLIAAATVFYLAPLPVIFGAALLVFGGLAWWRIDLSLLVIPIFVPYFMRPKRLGSHPLPPHEVLLGVVAAVAIVALGVWALRRGTPSRGSALRSPYLPVGSSMPTPQWDQLTRTPFLAPAAVFLLASVLSTTIAAEGGLAWRALLEVVLEPGLFFGLLLLFTPIQSPARRARALWLIGLAVVLAGAGQSFIGLGQYVTHHDLVRIAGATYERIRAWYGSPDNLGLLLDRSVPMDIAMALAPASLIVLIRSRRPVADGGAGGTGGPTPARTTILVLLAVMLAALLLTFVLGAWIATLLASASIVSMRLRSVWVMPLMLALALFLTIGVGSTHLGRTFSLAHAVTAGRRIDIWQSSLNMIRDHPLFGIGPDNFQHYYAPRRQAHIPCAHGLGYMEPKAWPEPCLSHPHDEILDFWLSTGILGLAGFIWLQFVFWRIVWRRRAELLSTAAILLGAAGAMLAGLIHGLVDNGYFLVDLSLLTWLLLGIASLHATGQAEDPG